MNSRWLCTVLSLLALAAGIQAQQPTTSPGQVNVGIKTDLGKKDFYKGWYLYWPAEALSRPRMPMPFPYWPQQGAAQTPQPTPNLSAPPGPAPGAPPGPLQFPRENPGLPALPPVPGSTSWAPGYYGAQPFQPVSYPYPAYVPTPGYWYYR